MFVAFDDDRGFPTSVSVDESLTVNDDEYAFSVEDFREGPCDTS